jgi:hypothetical protein
VTDVGGNEVDSDFPDPDGTGFTILQENGCEGMSQSPDSDTDSDSLIYQWAEDKTIKECADLCSYVSNESDTNTSKCDFFVHGKEGLGKDNICGLGHGKCKFTTTRGAWRSFAREGYAEDSDMADSSAKGIMKVSSTSSLEGGTLKTVGAIGICGVLVAVAALVYTRRSPTSDYNLV